MEISIVTDKQFIQRQDKQKENIYTREKGVK